MRCQCDAPPRPTRPREGGRGRGAVLYARVSSKDQEREGFSIPAQQRLLREFATKNHLTVVREFTDVETAKTAGRTAFGEMLTFLRKHREPRPVILVEKTDRLYRNLRDWVTLDDLHLTIHLVKENATISPDSRSTEKLVHGIKVLMAKNYVENLGEEASKGMLEKARSGIWPSSAPLGYVNTEGSDKRRTIIPDPSRAPLIRQAFTEYAKGTWSVKALATALRAKGLVTKKGNQLYQGTLHAILKNPVYAGWFSWNGRTYEGTYTPLITAALFNRVQQALARRLGTRERHVNHTFAYSGLITCATCGCLLVGEIKKGKYVYFHCTGQKGPCPKPYAREETLTAGFAEALKTISFPTEVIEWITAALKDSHQDEKAEHQERIDQVKKKYDQRQQYLDLLYEDRLAGRINTTQYDEKAARYTREQEQLQEELGRLTSANQDYMTTGLTILELASTLHTRFPEQPAAERQELLKLLVDKATWEKDRLAVEFREPWKALQTTRTTLVTHDEGLTSVSREWPARPDSNRRPSA